MSSFSPITRRMLSHMLAVTVDTRLCRASYLLNPHWHSSQLSIYKMLNMQKKQSPCDSNICHLYSFLHNPQVFSYVVHKKDAESPSRTASQPPVCSNLALHYTANNWLNWRGIGVTTIGHATRRRQTTQENTCDYTTTQSTLILDPRKYFKKQS